MRWRKKCILYFSWSKLHPSLVCGATRRIKTYALHFILLFIYYYWILISKCYADVSKLQTGVCNLEICPFISRLWRTLQNVERKMFIEISDLDLTISWLLREPWSSCVDLEVSFTAFDTTMKVSHFLWMILNVFTLQ